MSFLLGESKGDRILTSVIVAAYHRQKNSRTEAKLKNALDDLKKVERKRKREKEH